MKINAINTNNYKRQNFGVKMTKEVQRGFANQGYKIKEDFGEDSIEFKKFNMCINRLSEVKPDTVLDYDFDTISNPDDPYGLFPYTYILISKEKGKQSLINSINEKNEEDLYSIKNLKFLLKLLEK